MSPGAYRHKNRRRAAGLLLAASALSGCATSEVSRHFQRGSPVLFGGTRLNFAALTGNEATLAKFERYGILPPRYPLLDLPLSLVADVFVLAPFTVIDPEANMAAQKLGYAPQRD